MREVVEGLECERVAVEVRDNEIDIDEDDENDTDPEADSEADTLGLCVLDCDIVPVKGAVVIT